MGTRGSFSIALSTVPARISLIIPTRATVINIDRKEKVDGSDFNFFQLHCLCLFKHKFKLNAHFAFSSQLLLVDVAQFIFYFGSLNFLS